MKTVNAKLVGIVIGGTALVCGLSATVSGADQSSSGTTGADIMLGDIQSVIWYTPVGTIRAYAIGSHTCNIGDSSLSWISGGTPGLAMNAYRLHDGRLMQIGQGWVKHACCVINGNSPAVCGTNCTASGFGLRPGCLDVYSAGFNGGQHRLGPRSGINPYTGSFSPIPSFSGNSIDRRLQIDESDMSQATYPDALYFVEGVYACTEDAQNGNWLNNASYRRVEIASTFNMTLADQIQQTTPAIFAWHDYGNGPGSPDPSVTIVPVDIPNEGRFFVGARVSDNGDGTWRYEYAAYNLNSQLAADGLHVPVADGVTLSNIGFHSPDYHSGEPYSNAPWVTEQSSDTVTWRSPETFSENPNTNALRWGTMYNFWFDADQPPMGAELTLDIFRPTATDVVAFQLVAPATPETCAADFNEDGLINVVDMLAVLSNWGDCAPPCPHDLDDDGTVGVLDLLALLSQWGPCP